MDRIPTALAAVLCVAWSTLFAVVVQLGAPGPSEFQRRAVLIIITFCWSVATIPFLQRGLDWLRRRLDGAPTLEAPPASTGGHEPANDARLVATTTRPAIYDWSNAP